MSTKHTIGPWTHLEWSVTGPTAAAAMTVEQFLRLNEFFVPTTRVCQRKDVGKKVIALALGETEEEADANAGLIAAATDVLEALRVAVRQNAHDMVMTGEELRMCEAAIAKAEAKS